MESEKKDPPESPDNEPKDEKVEQEAPADALSKTPEELEQEHEEKVASGEAEKSPDDEPEKKVSPLKKFIRRVNVYFLGFMLIVAVVGAITVVNFLNSQKEPPDPNIANQSLTEEELKDLANKDATVGGTSQTLTIKGNAVIEGQTLMRGNLNIAGNLQTGGSIQGPSLTISGETNLGATQINSLEVAQTTDVDGALTANSLSIAGASTFGGAMKAPQLTVTRLIISGNGVLEIPNHITFTGPSPSRSITSNVLGNGGTASVNGSDTSGSITINTGGSPQAGCFVEVTFKQPYTRTPRVIVSPVGSAAGNLDYYVNRNTGSFSLCTNNAAQANKSFAFDFFVAG